MSGKPMRCDGSACDRTATYLSARSMFGRPTPCLCGRHLSGRKRSWKKHGLSQALRDVDDPWLCGSASRAPRDRESLRRLNAEFSRRLRG